MQPYRKLRRKPNNEIECGVDLVDKNIKPQHIHIPMNRFRSSVLPRLFSSVSKTEKMFDEAKTSSVFKKLKVGPMKRLYKYYTAESINLAGGLPMESTFPFKDINISIDGVDSFQLSKGKNLFLNYHRGDGLPALKEWVTKHVTDVHHPVSSFECCLSVGSTDSFAKTLNMIDSDCVIFDQHAYGAAVNTCVAFDKKPVGVKTDENGMIPDALRESVIALREKGLKANLVYFVPVGQNPTGTTISFQRKQEIYKVCQELDILIVEDGNYSCSYWLILYSL
jgi:DNA-binding transcriptional MocR family regulator